MGKTDHKEFIKIAVVGPESSGKSTLVKQLSKEYNSSMVSEFAREFLEKNSGQYSIKDLDFFAKEQLGSENRSHYSSPLFCDTNPLSIKVWSLYKYGTCSQYIEQLIKKSHYALQLLLKPDLPYEEDPLREDSPLTNRIELFNLFELELKKTNQDYAVISGKKKIRLNNAIGVVNSKFSF